MDQYEDMDLVQLVRALEDISVRMHDLMLPNPVLLIMQINEASAINDFQAVRKLLQRLRYYNSFTNATRPLEISRLLIIRRRISNTLIPRDLQYQPRIIRRGRDY